MTNRDGMGRVLVPTVSSLSCWQPVLGWLLHVLTAPSSASKGGRSTEFPPFSSTLGSKANLAYKLHTSPKFEYDSNID